MVMRHSEAQTISTTAVLLLAATKARRWVQVAETGGQPIRFTVGLSTNLSAARGVLVPASDKVEIDNPGDQAVYAIRQGGVDGTATATEIVD